VFDPSHPLGLIAGNRGLPLVLAREARAAGIPQIMAVGFEGETDPALGSLVDELVWLRVGQLGKMIQALASRGVRQCVMAGQLAPKNLFDVRPDLRAMGLLLRLREKNAHTIFGDERRHRIDFRAPLAEAGHAGGGFSTRPRAFAGATGGC
jgi:UDP-2,3-diacylglucosamine hydrolase